jgi:hypothetical protein
MPKSFADAIDTDGLTKKYQAMDLTPFKVLKVAQVNFRPHPFTIGPRHVEDATKHFGGILGKETINRIPCAATGCHLRAEDHTFDVVLMVQLTQNTTNEIASKTLKPVGKTMEDDGIDGLTLVETPEKYRVSK